MAISKYDQFDFLIDIVPRDELTKPPPTKRTNSNSGLMDGQTLNIGGQQVTIGNIGGNQVTIPNDQLQQLLLQQAIQQQQSASSSLGTQQLQVLQSPGPAGGMAICINSQGQFVQIQVPPSAVPQPPSSVTPSSVPAQSQPNDHSTNNTNQGNSSSAVGPTIQGQSGHVLLNPAGQLPPNQGGDSVQQSQQPQQQQFVLQHIVNSNGQVQQVPIQINAQQLQALRLQLANQASSGQLSTGQQILIQTGQQQQPQQYQIATSGGQQFVIASGATDGDGSQDDSQDGEEEEDEEVGLPVAADG